MGPSFPPAADGIEGGSMTNPGRGQYRKRMSMADDDSFRSYRSHDPYRRADVPRSTGPRAGGDPLAELARLIGSSDPLAGLGRDMAPSRQADALRNDYGAAAHDEWQGEARHERQYE